MKTAKMDINSSRVGDIRTKLRCEFGHEELRLLPDGWFYSQRDFEAWASFYEGGILPLRSRERAYGMTRHALQDDKHIDILNRNEAHWESVWATAPKFTGQIHLCTSDAVLLRNGDDGMLLSSLLECNRAMKPTPCTG